MRPRGGARPPSRGGRDEMDMPRRPRGPAPMPDARGMRPPPPQRYSPNREWRDWDDDEDDGEPSPGGQALKALGMMILFFAIGVGAAFGYYRVSAPKVVGEETPVTSPTVAPSASPSGSPSASPSATKTSFHFDPTGVGGAYIAVVAEQSPQRSLIHLSRPCRCGIVQAHIFAPMNQPGAQSPQSIQEPTT